MKLSSFGMAKFLYFITVVFILATFETTAIRQCYSSLLYYFIFLSSLNIKMKKKIWINNFSFFFLTRQWAWALDNKNLYLERGGTLKKPRIVNRAFDVILNLKKGIKWLGIREGNNLWNEINFKDNSRTLESIKPSIIQNLSRNPLFLLKLFFFFVKKLHYSFIYYKSIIFYFNIKYVNLFCLFFFFIFINLPTNFIIF